MGKKLRIILFLSLLFFTTSVTAQIKGIYLTQYTLENTAFLSYLIKHARASGIDTFVVDIEKPTNRYRNNIELLKENQIKYVARIVIFPDGGTHDTVKSPEVWQKKYRLVKEAIRLGAKEIQLDYIRYKSAQKPSSENSKNIHAIIQWYKYQLSLQNIPLQIDVFGITSFGESKHIGQNIKLFSQSVDAICPMVYPSHYVPFSEHYKTPYQTVYKSLTHIKKQFNNKIPFKLYAYIELSNYHYRMSRAEKAAYIKAQIKAVEEAEADGWYAWSPHNRYDVLFDVLQHQRKN